MNTKHSLAVLVIFLFHNVYCQIELSEFEKNKMTTKAETAVKNFQSTLTSLGSNNFKYDQKKELISDQIATNFENEKVRIVNDIESEGSEDYTIDVYLNNILVWFPTPKEVSFNYKIEKVSDVFINDDHTFSFIKVEVGREIERINNDSNKVKSSSKLDVYVKFKIVDGKIKTTGQRIYSITKHTEDLAFTPVPIRKEADEAPVSTTLKPLPTNEPSAPEVYTLSCTNTKCKTVNFNDEDDLYLYFKSPETGYLSAFLDDGKNCFKLLPYSLDALNTNSGMPIEASKEYILFSTEPQFNYNANKFFVEDSYQLVAETKKDVNHLFVIFSKSPLNRIDVKNNADIKILSEAETKKGYTIPQTLSSATFKNWMNNNINSTEEIIIKDIEITIQK